MPPELLEQQDDASKKGTTPAGVAAACFGGLVSKSYLAFGIVRNLAGAKALLGLPMLAAATPTVVVFLLGGASMAFIYAPLRAQGKPLVRFFGSDGDGVMVSCSVLKALS